MAQARTRSDPEISLFPFLSILVCLIGALVLLIVIMTMVQSAMGDGRSIEEVARARDADKMRREMEQQTKEFAVWNKQKEEAKKVETKLKQVQERFVLLRKRANTSADEKEKIEAEHALLQKQLENFLIQLQEMQREKPSLQASIEKLKAELIARKKNLDAKPRLVVQPSGSGAAAEDTKLFFVECNAGGIAIHGQGPEIVRITSGSIGSDAGYDEFLKKVSATPKSLLLFLLRDDGLGSYNRAAGWAESQFKVRTGKLPLPGQGEVDLSRFVAN